MDMAELSRRTLLKFCALLLLDKAVIGLDGMLIKFLSMTGS